MNTPTPAQALGEVAEKYQAMRERPDFLHQQAFRVAAEQLWEKHGQHFAGLEKENENLRTVMIAAAEEIHEHWDAHCDAEGYGPANLMRRLEQGFPAEYGYKSGDFDRLQKRAEAAEDRCAELDGKYASVVSRYDDAADKLLAMQDRAHVAEARCTEVEDVCKRAKATLAKALDSEDLMEAETVYMLAVRASDLIAWRIAEKNDAEARAREAEGLLMGALPFIGWTGAPSGMIDRIAAFLAARG